MPKIIEYRFLLLNIPAKIIAVSHLSTKQYTLDNALFIYFFINFCDMNKRYITFFWMVLTCSIIYAQQPNIILITTSGQGYADLGLFGLLDDVRTPNIDQLAANGVRMTAGYTAAPASVPSHAGILTGKYPQRFGIDDHTSGVIPKTEIMFPQHLNAGGYATGFVGHWKVPSDPRQKPDPATLSANVSRDYGMTNKGGVTDETLMFRPDHYGFVSIWQDLDQAYRTNFDLEGKRTAVQTVQDPRFRIDVQTDAALTFIKNHKEAPFFLHLSYDATNMPVEAATAYMDQYPEELPDRRRYFLATLSAIDSGVGAIRNSLKTFQLDENTLIIYVSDCGATLELYKKDRPLAYEGKAWNGSINDPFIGEQGMLTEGGIRIPFIMSWPAELPKGAAYLEAVSTIDIAPTCIEAAGLSTSVDYDGVNIIPYLAYRRAGKPHAQLFWRYGSQSAVLDGNWKLIVTENEDFLFRVGHKDHETKNKIKKHDAMAQKMLKDLEAWTSELKKPGLSVGGFEWEQRWYHYHFGVK